MGKGSTPPLKVELDLVGAVNQKFPNFSKSRARNKGKSLETNKVLLQDLNIPA